MLHSFAGSPQVLVRLAFDGFPIIQVLVDVVRLARRQVLPQAGWFRDAAVDGTHYGRTPRDYSLAGCAGASAVCPLAHLSREGTSAAHAAGVYRHLASRVEHWKPPAGIVTLARRSGRGPGGVALHHSRDGGERLCASIDPGLCSVGLPRSAFGWLLPPLCS